MNREVKARLGCVNLYFKTEDAGYVCRKCGISRPALRKWINRYNEQGIDGFQNQSRCPIALQTEK